MGKSLLFSYTLKNANPFSRKSMISWREQSDVRFSLPPNRVQSGENWEMPFFLFNCRENWGSGRKIERIIPIFLS